MRTEKALTLFILNEDVNDIVNIIKQWKIRTNWWSYWKSNTWNKKAIKWVFSALLAHLAASLVQSVISSVVKGIGRRGVRRAGREDMNKNFPLYPLSNIQITQYFNYEPRFKSIFSTKTSWQKSKGMHWVSLFIGRSATVCFDCFENGYIPQKQTLRQINYSQYI